MHLTRHLKRKHSQEEEVAVALKLPQKDQERACQGTKKAGIFKANMSNRSLNKTATRIREICQGLGETVMCTGCKGLYDAKSMFKHESVCEKNVSDMFSSAKMYQLSASATVAGVIVI